jgi:hypothetical protein
MGSFFTCSFFLPSLPYFLLTKKITSLGRGAMKLTQTTIFTRIIASMFSTFDDNYDCLFLNTNTSDITVSTDKSDTKPGGS